MKHEFYACPDDERCKSIEEYMQGVGNERKENFDYDDWKYKMQVYFSTWIDCSILGKES